MWEIIIAGAAAIKVPSLFEAAVRSVGERVCGPALDYLAQPMKDRAQRRARVSQAVAELAARSVAENPQLFQREVDRLLKQHSARQDRVEATFLKALPYLTDASETESANPEPPSDDWLNRWSRYAEDASSDKLQDAFARILAGEIIRKGSFSIGTLRTVSEMTMETAANFQQLWSETIGDYAVKYPLVYGRGTGWQRLLNLREAGLASFSDAAIHRPSTGSDWQFGGDSLPFLAVVFDPATYSEVPIINLTQIGRELGTILPPPDLETNLRCFAADCPDKRGWKSATLVAVHEGQLRSERLWTNPDIAAPNTN